MSVQPSAIACNASISPSSVPSGSVSVASRPAKNLFDAVRSRDRISRHGFGLDRQAVSEFAHQGLAGMSQRFQPRQPRKPQVP
jgi:hypothetical protein